MLFLATSMPWAAKLSLLLTSYVFLKRKILLFFKKFYKEELERLKEAEGSLIGGDSIHDKRIKYGMSVTGVVHPDKIWKNTGSKVGDEIFITKKLGVSLICGGYLQGEVDKSCYEEAKESMVTLNKYAADILRKFNPTSVTDVTGFGFGPFKRNG